MQSFKEPANKNWIVCSISLPYKRCIKSAKAYEL